MQADRMCCSYSNPPDVGSLEQGLATQHCAPHFLCCLLWREYTPHRYFREVAQM
jgi:hypothetical protein